MNDKTYGDNAAKGLDPKIAADRAEVEARRAELNSRDGGDSRRQAIMRRVSMRKLG